MSAKDKDLDFENYTVEPERANSIRLNMNRLREEGPVEDLKLLAVELGTEVKDEDPDGFLPGIGKEMTSKIYMVPEGHTAAGYTLKSTGLEFRIFSGNKVLLEISSLPKASEFLILHLEEDSLEAILDLKEKLKEEIKAARAKKNQRAASFKAKFTSPD